MSSKTDSFVKLAIVFFISLLSFSIGTFVGKKYSDNQHELANLEPQKTTHKAERDVASVEHGAETKTGTMTDEEIAKLAEEFVADDTAPVADAHGEAATKEEDSHGGGHHAETTAEAKHGEAKADAHKPTPAKKDTPVTKTEEPSAAAKSIAAGKTPTTTTNEAAAHGTAKKEDRVPSSLPKDVAQYTVGKFTVQVAAYAEESEAQKMASELKGKGYSAFYFPANVKGKTHYRVSVGQFATQKEAQTYRADFATKTNLSSAFVQKIAE